MNFIINGAFKDDTSNPSSLPLSILTSSSVILATRKWVYRNFRQKKGGSFEPPYRKCSTLPYCKKCLSKLIDVIYFCIICLN